jgi:enamine deaminase RidA (YjgF/YER057c/UK114 family)
MTSPTITASIRRIAPAGSADRRDQRRPHLFIAGQTAVGADGSVVGKDDFAAQAEQVFRNLSIALRARGCKFSMSS